MNVPHLFDSLKEALDYIKYTDTKDIIEYRVIYSPAQQMKTEGWNIKILVLHPINQKQWKWVL